jgi:hypothetical protein
VDVDFRSALDRAGLETQTPQKEHQWQNVQRGWHQLQFYSVPDYLLVQQSPDLRAAWLVSKFHTPQMWTK